jgi:diguanylate cyclase (GGDEF)-like protein/PAS domain S-box-containing protein
VLLALTPGVIATIYTGIAYREQAEKQARANAFRVMRLFVEFNDQMLRSSRLMLSTLAAIPEIKEGNSEALGLIFSSLLNGHPEFHDVLLLDKIGKIVGSARGQNSFAGGKSAELLASASQKRGFFVAGHNYDQSLRKALVTFGYPILNNQGDVVSVLAAQLDLQYWDQIIQNAQLPRESTFAVCDRSGVILFRRPDRDQWMGKPIQDTMAKAMASDVEDGAFRGKGLDGVDRLYAFVKLPMGDDAADLFLRIGEPEKEIYAAANAFFLRALLGVGLIAALVLAMARMVGKRYVLKPVNELVSAAQELGAGRLKTRVNVPYEQGELGLLAHAFDGMASALERRERERLAVEERLRESEARIRAMFNATLDSVMLVDTEGVILIANENAASRRNLAVEELVGKSLYDTLPEQAAAQRRAKILEAVSSKQFVAYDEERDDRLYRLRLFPICNSAGEITQLASYSRDITDRRRTEEQLKRQAFHDELTELPNRSYFMQQLKNAIQGSLSSGGRRYAVLFFDLDNFKLINDSLGHPIGDKILRILASRLRQGISPNAVLARFGGDEFAILLDNLPDYFEILRTADNIHLMLKSPLRIEGYEVHASASIGVVFGGAHYALPEQILRDADIAMYQAKAKGKGSSEIFDMTMHDRIVERMQLEHDLRNALSRGEIFLVYQPIFSLADLGLVGFEALIRWRHPEKGLIPPSLFIPLAEETGHILSLGEFVLTQACVQARKWQLQYPKASPFTINVNLSGKQFYQSDPVELVKRTLAETRLTPGALKLEITESLLLEDMEQAADILDTLRYFGARTALDDFGTGYSSLGYLRALPLDTLKMDRSFVNNMNNGNQKDVGIVRSIIELGHALEMDIVAEGIESERIMGALAQLGCDHVQGFLMAQPLAPLEAEIFLSC